MRRAAGRTGAVGGSRKSYFTASTVDNLDEILVLVSESPDLDLDFEVASGAATWAKFCVDATAVGR